MAVKCGNDRSHVFAAHRFVVRVRTAPDGRTGLRVSQLELESYAGRHAVSGDLPEVIQTAAEDIVAAGVTAQGIDVLVALRHLYLPEQDIANHFGRRLR